TFGDRTVRHALANQSSHLTLAASEPRERLFLQASIGCHSAMRNVFEGTLPESASCLFIINWSGHLVHQIACQLDVDLGLITPSTAAQEARIRGMRAPLLRAELRCAARLNRLGEQQLRWPKCSQCRQRSTTKNPHPRRHFAERQRCGESLTDLEGFVGRAA